MAIKLIKACKELNIGMATAVEFLGKHGMNIDTDPNLRIDDDVYMKLAKEFSKDLALKLEAERQQQQRQERDIQKVLTLDSAQEEADRRAARKLPRLRRKPPKRLPAKLPRKRNVPPRLQEKPRRKLHDSLQSAKRKNRHAVRRKRLLPKRLLKHKPKKLNRLLRMLLRKPRRKSQSPKPRKPRYSRSENLY